MLAKRNIFLTKKTTNNSMEGVIFWLNAKIINKLTTSIYNVCSYISIYRYVIRQLYDCHGNSTSLWLPR